VGAVAEQSQRCLLYTSVVNRGYYNFGGWNTGLVNLGLGNYGSHNIGIAVTGAYRIGIGQFSFAY